MKIITVALYLIIVIVLVVATFVERSAGSQFVHQFIYTSPWFIGLFAWLSVMGIGVFSIRKLWRRRFILTCLHFSFILILLGAFITHKYGDRGYIHIREGAQCNSYVSEGHNKIEKSLPFTMKLDSFQVVNYPGTQSASDYHSFVRLIFRNNTYRDAEISMNHILKYEGYRFYQSSFDDDKKGSWLSVNHDPWGIPVTYSGYLLLALSMIGFLVLKRETFRKLIKATSGKSLILIVLLFLMIPFSNVSASDIKDNTIPLKSAEKMISVPIVYKDRIAPFNTMALDFTKKITNKKSYKGLTAEQVVISIVLHTAQWMNEKIIYIKNERLRKELGLKGNYLSLNDLYQGNNYRLEEKVLSAQKEMHQNKYQKAIIACDEKVALITMLTKGTLYKSVPKSVFVDKIHLRAEVLYNKLEITPVMFKINIMLGFFAFFIFVLGLLRKKRYKWITYFTVPVIILDTVILTFLLGLRWYVSGHMPLSNGYETMNFMAWSIFIISFFLYRYSKIVPSATLVLTGFVLLVSSLGTQNPQITNLMPVLQSPWLSSHVSVLMISYALLSFTFINSIVAVIIGLIVKKEIAGIYMHQLKNISYLLLFPAVFLLGIGIFLGAVWANVSWGRYWGWDPKEVWALITFLVYSILFHKKDIPVLRKPFYFHIFLIFAFLFILMTYFGVNLFFTGMHSYK